MGLISEETIQRVTEANDIVEVIGSYFPLKKMGASFRALCPFHKEKTPSFYVNPARQSFHCFGCGAGGGVLRFVMDYEHVDFPTAVRRLAQRAGVPIIETTGGDEHDQQYGLRQRLLALHNEAADWFHHHLVKAPNGERARAYLKSRGITLEIAKSWRLGYAPGSWDALLDFLHEKKFTPDEIAQSGLASSKDEMDNRKSKIESQKFYSRFRDRVMFPICNDYGEVIAFSGRLIDPEAKTAKYVNSPETPLFTKGRVLYGLHRTKRDLIEKNVAIVCEGQLDLISAYEAGVRHVIAPQGTAFTVDQARLLRRFVETVLLCFDSDRAGEMATTRSLPALFSQGLNVKVVILPAGEDPDSLIRRDGAQAFLNMVSQAKDFFEYRLDKAEKAGELNEPAGKSRLVHHLGSLLSQLQDAVLREAVIGRLVSRLALSHATINAAVKAPPPQEEKQNELPKPIEKIPLSEGMRMLCQLALSHAEVRRWLREQESATSFESGGILLDKIARATYIDGEPAAMAAFLATLSAAEERTLAELDLGRPLSDPLVRAKQNWNGFVAERLRQQSEGLKNRLAQSTLSPEERIKIQKQYLDLKIRVADGFRPLHNK